MDLPDEAKSVGGVSAMTEDSSKDYAPVAELTLDPTAQKSNGTMTDEERIEAARRIPQPQGAQSIGTLTNREYDSYDTHGIHYEDTPRPGGVLPDAAKSIGGVSAITDSSKDYVPIVELTLDPISESSVVGGTFVSGTTRKSFVALTGEERIEAARKSLEAGLKEAGETNYEAASIHFSTGRQQLGDNGWSIDEETMLKLCSEDALASYLNGDLEDMKILIDDVLGRDLTVEQKFRCYEVKMLSGRAAGLIVETLNLGLEIRRQLGLYTPPNKPASTIAILANFIKTNRALGGRSAQDLASLPALTDEKIVMGQRILEILLTCSYGCQMTMFPLLVFLMVNATLKHGINASSCDAFVSFGIILNSVVGKPLRAREMGQAAELISAKPESARMRSRITVGVQGFINPSTSLLKDTIAPLLEGFEIGMKLRDYQSANLCLGMFVANSFYAGLPLRDSDQMIALHIASEHSDLYTELFIHNYFLAVRTLRGDERDEDERGIVELANANFKNVTLTSYVSAVNLELQVFFGEWETATRLLIEAGDVRTALKGPYSGTRFTFLESLVCFRAARSCSGLTRWKWKRRGARSMKMIQTWVKKGNVNLEHSLYLLEAERGVMEGQKTKKVADFYKCAISLSEKRGFLQDQALANEFASAFFNTLDGYANSTKSHIDEAIKCYSAWGAIAKVEKFNKELVNDRRE